MFTAMTDEDIINALGGTGAVAAALDKKAPAISLWKRRGIAWRYRPQIARMARDRGIMLPADFLVDL